MLGCLYYLAFKVFRNNYVTVAYFKKITIYTLHAPETGIIKIVSQPQPLNDTFFRSRKYSGKPAICMYAGIKEICILFSALNQNKNPSSKKKFLNTYICIRS